MNWSKFLSVICVALLLSGCGFKLRGKAQLPPEMLQTRLVVDDEYSVLARRVRVLLEQAGVQIVAAGQETAILEIPERSCDRGADHRR